MLERYLKYCGILLFVSVSCFRETPVGVSADFEIEVVDDDYSVPVTVRVTNKTAGADLYAWTFEGGEPATSNKYHPDEIIYNRAGKYLLRLEAWNTTERKTKELTIDLDSVIYARFAYQVRTNHFSPVRADFTNDSYGGSEYCWEFAGGNPSSYEGKNPPEILFTVPGEHRIRLRVSNSRETVEFVDTLLVLPPLSVDFAWQPGSDALDMEAPVFVKVFSRCTSALSYRWKVPGAEIENDTLPETVIRMDVPGTYRVELCASNRKDTLRSYQEINVLENTNLYKITDLKFGITTALNTIGAYYSSSLRKVLKADDLSSGDNPGIDFIFWGLPGFEQCCFISPDSAAWKAFPDIAGAGHTRIMNHVTLVTDDLFNMENDAALRRLEITDAGRIYFDKGQVPHYVLFETGDGRKGVIKVREFVEAGRESYVLADVKIQKESK